MACVAGHSVTLKSPGEGLVFNRNLVQLSIDVDSICSNECLEITRLNDGCVWHVSTFNKCFKQLIKLLHDCDNHIELKYCNATVKVTLTHKSIQNARYDVQPIYIINRHSDGTFQSIGDDEHNGVEAALRKIDLALELTQCIFSTKLNEHFGERSFELRTCEVFNSDLEADEARNMNQWELYDAMANELMAKHESEIKVHRKFVGFLSCTKFNGLSEGEEYSYENIKSKTFANPALGGGFLCLMGSGCFYSWPNNVEEVVDAFKNKKEIDLSELLDDSNYRKTFGGCFATSLGALAHEIGHIFDLAHTETGLMGNDIDYTHRFFLTENFTECLPKRIVRSCHLQDKKKETNCSNQRLTKIKKPGGVFLGKYYEQKGNDLTFFEPNCLTTLWSHRWFSQAQGDNRNLSFFEETRTVISKISPIKLVELREPDSKNAMLIKFWSLLEINVNEFQIPANEKLSRVTIFAITSQGEILKTFVTN